VPTPPPSAQTAAVHDPDTDQATSGGHGGHGPNGGHGGNGGNGGPGPSGGNGNGGNGDEREAERGLRGLVGSGASQVSLSAAMRARDAARPDEDELAAAERDLVIVRRGWVPREDLPRTLR
jgi:hypothetical protein